MRIVVCCKAVPGIVTELALAPDKRSLQYQGQLLSMNECDEYALEEALALKRAHGGSVTVITMGSIKTQDILYLALAKGADRAVRVDFDSQDSRVASAVLAASVTTSRNFVFFRTILNFFSTSSGRSNAFILFSGTFTVLPSSIWFGLGNMTALSAWL